MSSRWEFKSLQQAKLDLEDIWQRYLRQIQEDLPSTIQLTQVLEYYEKWYQGCVDFITSLCPSNIELLGRFDREVRDCLAQPFEPNQRERFSRYVEYQLDLARASSRAVPLTAANRIRALTTQGEMNLRLTRWQLALATASFFVLIIFNVLQAASVI